ncbi:MAG: stage II sporulation protein P [Clostridia bacterium]|nr:stage II sporulation protein P [Clostridia bacterium]
MMKKVICFLSIAILSMFVPSNIKVQESVKAENASEPSYFTIYDAEDKTKVVLTKGEGVEAGDKYISSDNKMYEIVEVDEKNKVGFAKFEKNVEIPKYRVKPRASAAISMASAKTDKAVGIYHTHNDESYLDADGTDSVYGKGGIHDIGKKLKSSFESLGVSVAYSENLHLPHNSGAYTRSQVTASSLLSNNNIQGLFDIHRDSTPRSEYITKVNGTPMTKIRMVVGSANANFEENQNFAYAIKGYADAAYPNFIKDIYIGKGNYNQQLTPRAMLFEFGCEKIEKEYALASAPVLAKVLDVVLYGSENASNESMADVTLVDDNGNPSESVVIQGLAYESSTASLGTLWAVIGALGFYALILGIVCLASREARFKTKRFFSETFAGLFGKTKHKS